MLLNYCIYKLNDRDTNSNIDWHKHKQRHKQKHKKTLKHKQKVRQDKASPKAKTSPTQGTPKAARHAMRREERA